MPGRQHPLITDNIYHVFNKTIDQKRIFASEDLSKKYLDILTYYRSSQSLLRFSTFQNLPPDLKSIYEKKIFDKRTFRVSIFAYCLMPTHFHLLLRQKQDNGISFFISQIQNSFTRFYNVKNERVGPIFLHRFKSKLIQTEEQFKHVSRYIHLNPFSSGIITDKENLELYLWSSFDEYLKKSDNKITETDYLFSLFNRNINRYKKFVLDNAEYQKTLEYCKYTNTW